MKLIIQGGRIPHLDSDRKALNGLLQKIRTGMRDRLPNVAELDEIVEEVYITQVELNLQFKVKGMDELQEMTVNHHGEPELLTVIVDIDKDGNIVELDDNENGSLYTETMVQMMNGTLQREFTEIESELNINDLVQHEVILCRDFQIKFYSDPINKPTVWVQFCQKSEFDNEYKLIQEVKYTLKEDESLEDVVNKYKTVFE